MRDTCLSPALGEAIAPQPIEQLLPCHVTIEVVIGVTAAMLSEERQARAADQEQGQVGGIGGGDTLVGVGAFAQGGKCIHSGRRKWMQAG
jgi:hypothetical protein